MGPDEDRVRALTASSGYPMSLLVLAARLGVAVLGGGAACRSRPSPAVWHQEIGYRWRSLTVPARGGPGLAELSPPRTGIRFTNTVMLDSVLWNRHPRQGGRGALDDGDGEGLTD